MCCHIIASGGMNQEESGSAAVLVPELGILAPTSFPAKGREK
jgi:hypothetical protein